jgi:hypothetical protein
VLRALHPLAYGQQGGDNRTGLPHILDLAEQFGMAVGGGVAVARTAASRSGVRVIRPARGTADAELRERR